MRIAIRSPAHAAFGNVVREIRNQRSMSQEALADECGLDRTYISGIERGQRNPSLTNILKLSDALQISSSEIFARAEIMLAAITPPRSGNTRH